MPPAGRCVSPRKRNFRYQSNGNSEVLNRCIAKSFLTLENCCIISAEKIRILQNFNSAHSFVMFDFESAKLTQFVSKSGLFNLKGIRFDVKFVDVKK